MNGATRELRRVRGYVAAAIVAVGGVLVGLPWFVAGAIAVDRTARRRGDRDLVERERRHLAARSRSRRERPADGVDPLTSATFRREGEYWTIAYRDTTFRLHDAKGLGYLHRLLAAPGQEVHVLDLVVDGRVASAAVQSRASETELPSRASASEPLLDRQAREAYRQRIEVLRDQIEEAEEHGDLERASRAREELDFIAEELHRQLRGDGTSRTAPDATERARVNVSRAIRASIAKIEEQDASLGHHLDHDIRTGTYCVYLPDPAGTPAWRL